MLAPFFCLRLFFCYCLFSWRQPPHFESRTAGGWAGGGGQTGRGYTVYCCSAFFRSFFVVARPRTNKHVISPPHPTSISASRLAKRVCTRTLHRSLGCCSFCRGARRTSIPDDRLQGVSRLQVHLVSNPACPPSAHPITHCWGLQADAPTFHL